MGLFDIIMQYSEYIIAVAIIILSVVVAKLLNYIIKRHISKLTKRTESELDDMIVAAIRRPLFYGILLGGVYIAIRNLSVLAVHAANLSMVFTVIFILFGAYIVSRLINAVIEWYGKEIAAKTKTKADEQFLPIFKKVVLIIVYGLAGIWILNQLGIQVTTLIAAMGIGGLAIALALQGTLTDFFAGAHIVLDRPIRIGDYIEIEGGDRGKVVDIGWRTTRIRNYENNLVILPNSKLAESKIVNYYSPSEIVGFIIPVGVAYSSDLERVEKIALQIAKKVLKDNGGVEGFEPKVRFKEFGDSSINFSVFMKVKKYSNKFKARHEFIKQLKKKFDKEKIEIAFPQLDVHLKKK